MKNAELRVDSRGNQPRADCETKITAASLQGVRFVYVAGSVVGDVAQRPPARYNKNTCQASACKDWEVYLA